MVSGYLLGGGVGRADRSAGLRGDGESARDGVRFCPYCGVQAPADAWLTEAQRSLAENIIAREVIGPTVSKLGTYRGPEKLDPLTEVDDMTRVDFPCHSSEPLKVQGDWRRALRCLICGMPMP